MAPAKDGILSSADGGGHGDEYGVRFLAGREMIECVYHDDASSAAAAATERAGAPVDSPPLSAPSRENNSAEDESTHCSAAPVTSTAVTSTPLTSTLRKRSVQFKFEDDDSDDLDMEALSCRKTPLPPIFSDGDVSDSSSNHSPMYCDTSPKPGVLVAIETARFRPRAKSLGALSFRPHAAKQAPVASSRPKPKAKNALHKPVDAIETGMRSLTVIREGESMAGERVLAPPHPLAGERVLAPPRPPARFRERSFTVDDRMLNLNAKGQRRLATIRARRTSRDVTREVPVGRKSSQQLASAAVKPFWDVDLGYFAADPERLDFIKTALSPAPCPFSPESVRRRSVDVDQSASNKSPRNKSPMLRKEGKEYDSYDELDDVITQAARDIREKFPFAEIYIKGGRDRQDSIFEETPPKYDVDWGKDL